MFSVDNETPAKPGDMPEAAKLDPDKQSRADEQTHDRHGTLIDCLHEEAELQAEERIQMAIDGDYQDHLHWRDEDAQVLMARGQAPLVFNEGRQTIEWASGMQKRMRMDYNILPREESDQAGAEAKTKVFKYVSDANLSQWHESFAFKQAIVGGLGWLEEGINTDPGAEQIYAGSEDWKNVYRDSRTRNFDLNVESRYLFRKKRTDLDYAIALLPWAKQHLLQQAGKYGDERGEDVWYLGEQLTGSSDLAGIDGHLPSRYRDRSAYIGGPQGRDKGRRLSLDLMEAWYRVPEAVEVFANGPQRGKTFNPKDPGHVQLQTDRWAMYGSVAMRMRVMICTESAPIWDGVSPFKHGKFLLVPVWGYRRGRDGQCYGMWRGMRDLNDDINKRASKALHAASSNRLIFRRGAFDDIELAREEAAKPNMMLEVRELTDVAFEKPTADMQMNLELLSLDREMLQNVGGVTNDNLGRDSNVVSGKAVGLKQDQGSLTTSEIPDHFRLAKQQAGRLRLSHIEQFMTERQVIRIVGEAKPIEWLTINDPQPDGSVMNDISNREADFIIGERDYRESYAQAALQSMMELLGQIATYAPQVVMSVLDLVVESAEIKDKDEWVARIRKLNGQRDPRKTPTPEELAKQQQDGADEAKAKAIQLDTMQAGLDKLRAEVGKLDTDAILKRVESMFSALQAAQIVAVTPTVAPIADTIAAGAGFEDQGGADPNLPLPAVAALPPEQPAMPPEQMEAPPEPIQGGAPTGLEGVQSGIETPTSADNAPELPPQGI